MNTLIIAFLIAIGVISSAEDFNNLTVEEQTHYTSEDFIDDEVVDLLVGNKEDSEGN